MKTKDAINVIERVLDFLNRRISKTPTGNRRNTLANANIFLMSAIDEMKKVSEYENRRIRPNRKRAN